MNAKILIDIYGRSDSSSKKRIGITGKVIIFFDARLSAEIENVVYHLIYAIIIPNFKEIVAYRVC